LVIDAGVGGGGSTMATPFAWMMSNQHAKPPATAAHHLRLSTILHCESLRRNPMITQDFSLSRELLVQVSISRRLLEKRFQHFLNCSPHAYLCRLRTEKAKHLLENSPDLKIHAIAKSCGFGSQDRMRLVFLRLLGATPQDYRKGILGRNCPKNKSSVPRR
jgi:transcriptional regulator GlxA family with amidase domain